MTGTTALDTRGEPFVLLDDARATLASADRPARLYSCPVDTVRVDRADEWDAAMAMLATARRDGLHAAGYLTYEAGLLLEDRLRKQMRRRARALGKRPLAWFGLFEGYEELPGAAVADRLPDPAGAWLGALSSDMGRAQYAAAFDRVQEYIRAGDIYQANLTFRAHAPFAGHPLALYALVRARAQTGYGGALFDGRDWALSFSPELFFAVRGGRLRAKPMKGTAVRASDPKRDAEARKALRSDPKQRAENLMIVDLLRNDLSRIAERGSVAVPSLFDVETSPTVHAMTSTITAELAPGADIADLLRALYPCGSITGAPKIRAMEIIDELEPSPRGIYCGAIGRIDADARGAGGIDAAFNVAIRTFHIAGPVEGDDGPGADKRLSLGLGSGIVADSEANAEWRECLAKGEFARVEDQPKVDLIETMAFEPASGVARLESHLERMKRSAAALGFSFDRHAARNAVHAATFTREDAAVVRLLLARSGATAIECRDPPPAVAGPLRCRIVERGANAEDYRLAHKTTDRRVYESDVASPLHPLFADRNGFLTEGAIWNLFVEGEDGVLRTPPLSRGLLPGRLRAALIEEGRAREADLTPDDLRGGFLLGNSVRGLCEAVLEGPGRS